MDQPPAPRVSYAGPATCLHCDDVFESWDRRQNRSTQPSDEIRHATPTRRRFTPEEGVP
jgi:hypothetical protein